MDKNKQRNDEDMKWSILASEQLINRPWMKARRDTVQLPNGKIYDEYYVLSYTKWINVIAETEDIDVFLCPKEEVKQMLLRGEFIQALMVAPLWKYFSIKD